MGFRFNPFTGNLDFDSAASATSWLQPVGTEASLPLGSTDGDARVTLDTDFVWVYDANTSRWINSGIKSGDVGTSPNLQGFSFLDVNVGANRTERRLILQPANSTNPGVVNTLTQSFAGDKTFNDNVIITGDLTVNGTTTSINSTNLEVTDKNITVNKNGNDASSEGAGFTVERTGTDGSIVYEDALVAKFKAGALGSEIELANVSSTQSLTNKTIDADQNTITNIEDADIKNGAAINAAKISSGIVSNTEFDYLDGVTSSIQTQLGNKANLFLSNLSSPTAVNQDLLLNAGKTLRLPSDVYLVGRNSTDTGNINLIKVDAFNRTTIASGAGQYILFDNDILPTTANNKTIGISSFALADVASNKLTIANNQEYARIDLTSGTPSGAGSGGSGVAFNVSDIGRGLFLFTSNNTIVDATPTRNVIIETGNKTVGTGNSGDINLQTGTSFGGTRGNISMNANQINMTVPLGGTVLINGSGATLRGSSATSLALGTPSIPMNASYFRSQNTGPAITIQSRTVAGLGLLGLHGNATTPTGLTTGANVYNLLQELDQSGNGNLILFTAANTASSIAQVGGAIFLETGNRTSGTPGAVSGAIRLQTGTSNNGPSGDISFITGTGTTRGKIKLVNGTEGTIGHVWTQTAVDGSGSWQVGGGGAGANTTLSNLVNNIAIPNGVHLLPANDLQVNLGSTTKRFQDAFINTIKDSSNVPVLEVTQRQLVDENGNIIMYFDSALTRLLDPSGLNVLQFSTGQRRLYDTTGNESIEFNARQLKSTSTVKLDWSGTDVSLNTRKLINVSNGTAANDAVNKSQLDTKADDSIVIKKDGSVTYTANQPMGGFKLTGLAAGTGAGDSVRYEQAILTNGTNPFTADQSMGSNKLTNVVDPTAAQDAATKNYVDNQVSNIVTPTWKKYTVNESAFTAASSAENIELFSLPSKGTIHAVVMKHTASFTGGGLTSFNMSIGVSGNLTKYASSFDVFQTVGSNVSQSSNSLDVEDFSSPTSIRLSATSIGANVNDATAGDIDVYVLWGVLP